MLRHSSVIERWLKHVLINTQYNTQAFKMWSCLLYLKGHPHLHKSLVTAEKVVLHSSQSPTQPTNVVEDKKTCSAQT